MFRLFKIYRNTEAGDASGGAAPVSTPSTADNAQSGVVGSASPAANDGQPASAGATESYTSDYFVGLESKSADELGAIAPEVLDAYDKWVESGRKPSQAPKVAEPSKKEVAPGTEQANKPGPKTEEDIKNLVENTPSNQWTDGQAKAIRAAMDKVGAKTPEELLQKTEGALQLAGKKGQEAGEAKSEIESYRALMEDLRAGRPEAIQFLQDEYGLTLAQAKAAAQQQGAVTPKEEPGTVPDDVLDVKLYNEFQSLKKQSAEDRKALQELQQSLQSAQKAREQEAAQAHQEAVNNRAREDYIEQFMQIADEDPDTYAVKSGNLRKMLSDFYYRKVVDPRLANHIKLAEFARDQLLPSLKIAHTVKSHASLSQKIIDAERRGRESALNQGRSQGLSSVRDSGAGETVETQYSPADIQKMATGAITPPDNWFNKDGILDKGRIPAQYHKDIFG